MHTEGLGHIVILRAPAWWCEQCDESRF
ncbi:MAG: YgiT-type zinc finger protein [Paeniglutamicibacter terrestris]